MICYKYKRDNDPPLSSVTMCVCVNIYRELRIDLYYKSMLGSEVNKSISEL